MRSSPTRSGATARWESASARRRSNPILSLPRSRKRAGRRPSRGRATRHRDHRRDRRFAISVRRSYTGHVLMAVSLNHLVLSNQASAAGASVTRKPSWLKMKMPGGAGYGKLRKLVEDHRLHTVCQSAKCPNLGECWDAGTATLMILGDICTRSCRFCNIATGKPTELDLDE